jgi:hypothetical protein
MTLPPDSGVNLTLTTPTSPQTRDADFYSQTPRRARIRFWRRNDGSDLVWGGGPPTNPDRLTDESGVTLTDESGTELENE